MSYGLMRLKTEAGNIFLLSQRAATHCCHINAASKQHTKMDQSKNVHLLWRPEYVSVQVYVL